MKEIDLSSESKSVKERKYFTINVRPKSHKFILLMSEKNSIGVVDLVDLIIDYIKKSGFDPKDTDLQTPHEELKKLRNTFISFMRTHEKEILLPLVTKTDVAVNTLIDFIKSERGNVPNFNTPKSDFPTVQEAIKKGDFKIPIGNIKTQEEQAKPEIKEIPLNVQMEIQKEKLEKENKYLKEELQNLLKSMSPKSYGSGYVVDISKDKFNELLGL